MADVKVSALTALTGANLANGDELYVVDVGSPNVSKKITADELAQGSQFSSRFVPKSGDAVGVGPGEMWAADGSPALAGYGWQMDPSSNEAVRFYMYVPAHWTTYDLDIVWANSGAGSGDVQWTMYAGSAEQGDDVSSLTALSFVDTAGAQNIAQQIRLGVTVNYGIGGMFEALLYRQADSVSDTLANDCALIGVILTRAS
jgi:hypothetical protein